MIHKFKLGGVEHKLDALTIDQLQTVLPAFTALREPGTAEGLAAIRLILATAIGKTPEEVGAMKATMPELLAAIDAVARVSGLRELGEGLAASAKAADAA